ncbi:hypothetical protein FOZ63_002552, partial [Perkinsus olseni]
FREVLEEIKSKAVKDRDRLPDLRGREVEAVGRARAIEEEVIEACGDSPTIQSVNDAMYAAAATIIEACGVKLHAQRRKKRRLPAKRRLENKVKVIRRDLEEVDAGYRFGGRVRPSYKLEHLLFVDDLKAACDVGEASGLKFGMPKCAWVDIVRGFPVDSRPDEVPDELVNMKYLSAGERYKYLGVPQCMLPDA